MSDDDVPDLVADELDDELEGINIIHVDIPWGVRTTDHRFAILEGFNRWLREWIERFQTKLGF